MQTGAWIGDSGDVEMVGEARTVSQNVRGRF